ncbi:serine/threonine-protein kinase PAK 5-like [Oreochromis aureus]|uniref:serine/threonine-protein kinase PAK 5-like n=1 Tax=Oreochromis aureus TaxID=47969 RepID=UPI0019542637|nr:serine/threonine-protein kinase PAK 5-like [Oreochromis aureus]
MMDTANSVTKLNEYANTRKFEVRYEEIRSDGPPHDKVFYLSAVIDGKAYPSGEGKTKKEAKQNAAKNALESLSQLGHQDSVESRNTAAEASVQMILSSKDTSFTETNFIGLINDYCQRTKRSDSYVKVKKDGPSHIPLFFYKLIIDNKEYPVGDGKSIMEAKQRAAELACSALQEQPDWDSKVSVRPTALEDGAPPDSLASSVTQESIESSSQGLTTDKSESVIFEESSNPPTDQRNNAAEASVQMVPSSKDTSFTETDFKSLVNRYCQKTKRSHSYVEVKKDGPSHIPHFFYKLIIDNKEYPVGDGKSIMEAKQRAAELAWSALQEQPDWDSMVSIRPTASEDGAPPESLASSVTQESIESSSQGLTTDKSESVIFDESSNPPTDQRNNAAEASVQMVPSSKDTSFTETDFKSLVNRYCQKTRRSHSYVEVKKDGPSHIPHFFYKLIIDNKEYPVGDGKSIMEAKQRAAELAWSALQEQPDWDSMVSIRPTASEDGAPPESLASSVTQESIESSSQGLTTDKSESVIFEESSNPSTDQRNNAAEASVQMVPSSKDTSFTETDFKSLVNRYCQKTRRSHSYVEFFYKLIIDNKEYPVGDGKSIMEAKQRAAELAWSALQEQPDWDSMVSIRPTASEDGAPPESLASSVTQESIESSSQGLTTDKSESVIFEESSNPPTDQRNNAAEASVQMVPSSKDTSFTETDFKSLVNRYCQKTRRSHSYVEVKKDGPSHIPHFFYKLIIDNKEYPVGDGKSIMEAKQRAAELAWSALQEQPDWDSMVSIRPTASEDGAPPESLASSVTQNNSESSSQNTASNSSNPSDSQAFSVSSGPETSTSVRFTSEFEPLERLGKGAFGSVYKVRDKKLKIEYAVKVGCYKEKSLREVRTLSDLFHRNIVRYYTFWMQDTGYEWDLRDDSYDSYASSHHEGNSESKFLYIQMELCAKNTLRDWIDEKNKESVQDSKRREESLRIAQEIVCGVEYIHSKNHIHRDLKPANIMFGVEGEVKIGDFGLVTSDDDDEERTVCKGTPSYMAPEQRSERKYNRKVDMFALGLIFFELLWKLSTGYERAKIWPDVRRQRFPEEFSVTFTKEKQIINSLLSEKPEDRPDASAVKAELEEWTRIFNSHKASCQENQTV